MFDRSKVEVDGILLKFVIRILDDRGTLPIEIYYNAGVEVSSFGVRTEAVK